MVFLVSSAESEDHSAARPAKEPKTTQIFPEFIENAVDQQETKQYKVEAPCVQEKEQDNDETEKTSNNQDIQPSKSCSEEIQFRVVWNKKNYDVTFGLDETADSLKQHIESLTGSNCNDPLCIAFLVVFYS